MCLCKFMPTYVCRTACGGQKRVLKPLELKLEAFVSLQTWVMGSGLRPSWLSSMCS